MRHLQLCIILCSGLFCLLLTAGEAAPKLQISVTALGVTGGTLEADALIAQMNEGGWCTAALSPRPTRWNKRPEPVPPGEWVSVVLAGFGNQAHALAFQFDARGGARLLSHVPYGQTWLPSNVTKWIPPVSQIAESIRLGLKKPAAELPRATLTLGEWAGREEKDPAAPSAATVSNREGFPPLEALFCAAACESGWMPSAEQTDNSLKLDARFEFKSAALKVTQAGGVSGTQQKLDAAETHYFGVLKRLLFLLKKDCGVSDFGLLNETRARLLSASSERIVAATDAGALACDPRTGKRLWTSPPAKHPDAFTAHPAASGAPRIYRFTRDIAVVDPATGAQKTLSPDAPHAQYAFAAHEDGAAVVAQGSLLSAHRNAAMLWRKDGSDSFSAGPLLADGLIFAGTAQGELICFGLNDGAEKWRKSIEAELRGPLSACGKLFTAYSKSDDSLHAISMADGAVRWKLPLGDAPLEVSSFGANQFLAAAKNNRIVLAEIETGKIAAEVRWPTWLVDVLAVSAGGRTLVVCTDIRGRVSILDEKLKTLREISLPARPNGELMFVQQFPAKWGAAGAEPDLLDGEVKKTPAVLVTDNEGFCYIIHIP